MLRQIFEIQHFIQSTFSHHTATMQQRWQSLGSLSALVTIVIITVYWRFYCSFVIVPGHFVCYVFNSLLALKLLCQGNTHSGDQSRGPQGISGLWKSYGEDYSRSQSMSSNNCSILSQNYY